MNAASALRVLLVDDHAIVREGYRALLARQPDLAVVGEAADADEAYQQAVALQPQVVIIDVSLPGASGLSAVARIHRRLPDCALLVFTMHAHPTYATQAFEAGARGYVTKASPADELIAAIRAVARGARFLSDDIAQALAIERLDHARSCLDALSPREFEVLRLLVQAHPVAAIAESLHLSPKTVMNLHYAIKRKLEVDTDIELTRLAARLGLIDDA